MASTFPVHEIIPLILSWYRCLFCHIRGTTLRMEWLDSNFVQSGKDWMSILHSAEENMGYTTGRALTAPNAHDDAGCRACSHAPDKDPEINANHNDADESDALRSPGICRHAGPFEFASSGSYVEFVAFGNIGQIGWR